MNTDCLHLVNAFFLSILLTAAQPILAIPGSKPPTRHTTAICADVLVQTFPPTNWKTYLQNLAASKSNFATEQQQVISTMVDVAPPDDYRFYLVPKFIMQGQEVSEALKDSSLQDNPITDSSYLYSYIDHASGDQWAVFQSKSGEKFNINVSLFPPKKAQFSKEFLRVKALVESQTRSKDYDAFFEKAIYLQGGWNLRPLQLQSQNQIWPASNGARIETYPIGPPLGSKHDHLMVKNEYIFFRDDHIVVQNISRFRSAESREANLERGKHYLGVPEGTETEVLKKGQEKFLDLLIEIHESIFPDYVLRRGWTSEEFIQKLFDDGISMQNHIEFTVVREITSDLKFGKIIGVVGYNVSAYGHTKYFDLVQNQWLKATGLTGTSVARHHPDKVPWGDASYDPQYWSAPIAKLPVETFLKEGMALARPSILERIERPSSRTLHQNSLPIFFSSGENLEVTRLWVKKGIPDRKKVFAKILYSWIHRIYESDTSLEYTLKAISHVTYNPEKEGRLLYVPFGYTVNSGIELKQDALKNAVLFISDSERFMRAISEPSFLENHLSEEELAAFLFYLEFNLDRFWIKDGSKN